MKKVYRMENLDCANCARKMEDAIQKLDGVESVNINFLTQKIILLGCAVGSFAEYFQRPGV